MLQKLVLLILLVLIILVVIAAVRDRKKTPSSPVSAKKHLPPTRKKLPTKSIRKSRAILAEASCPAPDGILVANASLNAPCYTFTCDTTVNIHSLLLEKVLVEPPGTLTAPLDTLPLLSPGSDVTCPDTPIGGDPYVTSIIDQNVSFQKDWLIFTNNGSHPTAPSPAPSTGPWYFEKEPFSLSNKTVITCGCREEFDPSSTRDDEKYPPHQSESKSIIDITFDTGILDPATAKVSLDLSAGYSSEANYDFFTIAVDGVGVFLGSGPGASASDPYRKLNMTLVVDKTSTVRIQYYRDPAVYGGVDSVYFTINKATPVFALSFPTTLVLKCGSTIIKDYTALTDLDGQGASLTIDCPVTIEAGCELCLEADPEVYAQYNVTASYQNIPQIYDHRFEEKFTGPVDFNLIKYNNRDPTPNDEVGGWYNTDDQFTQNLVFIQQVSGLLNRRRCDPQREALLARQQWSVLRERLLGAELILHDDPGRQEPLQGRFDSDCVHLRPVDWRDAHGRLELGSCARSGIERHHCVQASEEHR